MLKPLQDKIVLITGAAGLLGRAFVEACFKAGAIVVAVDIDARAASKLLKKFKGNGQAKRIFFQKCDTTNEKQIGLLFKRVLKRHKRIDALVNSAYPRNKNYGKKFDLVSYADFCDNVSKHLGGYFVMTQKVSEIMKRQRAGTILSLGSIYGSSVPKFEIYQGTEMTMPIEYAAIKAAVIQLGKYLAAYLGPYNIRVNTLSPGGILNNQPKAFQKKYSSHVPLGKRMGQPGDITGALVFLLSDDAAYITGQDVIVDGGWSL